MSYLYSYILLSLEKDIGVRDILSFYDIGLCTFGANTLPLRTVWGKYSNPVTILVAGFFVLKFMRILVKIYITGRIMN